VGYRILLDPFFAGIAVQDSPRDQEVDSHPELQNPLVLKEKDLASNCLRNFLLCWFYSLSVWLFSFILEKILARTLVVDM